MNRKCQNGNLEIGRASQFLNCNLKTTSKFRENIGCDSQYLISQRLHVTTEISNFIQLPHISFLLSYATVVHNVANSNECYIVITSNKQSMHRYTGEWAII